MTIKKDLKLTRSFNTSDFLESSTIPKISNYSPSKSELLNLQLLANLLQKAIDAGYPIKIVGGARPLSVTNDKGQNFYEALKARGFEPSKTSDHYNFAASDVWSNNLPSLYGFFQAQDDTRQVIYYPNDNFIHVAVKYPGHGRIAAPYFAFIKNAKPKSERG